MSFIIIILTTLIAISSQLFAKEKNILNPDDLFKMSFQEMMKVKIITAGKKTETVSEIPASVVIVTREDIKKYGYKSLEDILRSVPGIYAINDMGPYRSTFGVRGFWTGTPRSIIFLINGVQQSDGFLDFHLLDHFNLPVEAIDKIEIVRGPLSIMYGAGSFFGAINIITNSSDNYKPINIISASYGTDKTKRVAVRASGKEANLQYDLNAGYYDTYGPDEQLSSMISPSMQQGLEQIMNNYKGSYSKSTEGRLEDNSKHINVSIKNKNFYSNLSYNKSQKECYAIFPSYYQGTSYLRKTGKGLLGYKKIINDLLTIDGKISYHNTNVKVNMDIFSEKDSGQTSGGSEIFEVEFNAFFKINDNFDITNGIFFQRKGIIQYLVNLYDFNVYNNINLSEDIITRALFSQLNYRISKLKIVAGIRLDQQLDYSICYISNNGQKDANNKRIEEKRNGYFNEDSIELIPRLAAIYDLNENHIIKLLYGKAITRPSFFQNCDQLGNKLNFLEIEKIQTFEINYIAKLFKNVTLQTSIFYNILDNLIIRKFQFIDTQMKTINTNAGKMVTKGTEFFIKYAPSDNFITDFAFTFQNTEDKRTGFEDKDVEYSPELLAYFKSSYKPDKDITLSLIANYIDEMECHLPQNIDNTPASRIGKKVDDYFLVDFNLRIDNILNKGYYFNFKCNNIFDKEYFNPTYYHNSTWEDIGTIGNRRFFMVTMGKIF